MIIECITSFRGFSKEFKNYIRQQILKHPAEFSFDPDASTE